MAAPILSTPVKLGTSKPKILAYGNSHLGAIEFALRSTETKELPFHISCLPFIIRNYAPHWEDSGSERVPIRHFRNDFKERIEVERPDLALCFCASNFMLTYGTFISPRPFDFAVPGREDLPLTPNIEVVPYNLMRECAQTSAPWWSTLLLLACASGIPTFSVCLPPPLLDIEPFLLADSHKALRERFGVGTPAFRYKMWLIQSEADRCRSKAAGARFLEPPKLARDAMGFRLPQMSNDIIHANACYGSLILNQIHFGDLM